MTKADPAPEVTYDEMLDFFGYLLLGSVAVVGALFCIIYPFTATEDVPWFWPFLSMFEGYLVGRWFSRAWRIWEEGVYRALGLGWKYNPFEKDYSAG